MSKSFAFHTLGCKLNFSESSTIGRSLEGIGLTKKKFDEGADVYVINTCSVTENADKECKQLVRKIRRQSPDSKIVITGCYAQLKSTEIAAIEGVDLVVGTDEKFNLHHHIGSLLLHDSIEIENKIYSCDINEVTHFNSSYSLNDRTRTFLKVQDGCDYNCSFCTIPQARGGSRSDTITGVIENIKELALAGIKEVVLTGVNLGDFGNGFQRDRGLLKYDFFELIREIEKQLGLIGGIERMRISSIEPNLLSDEIIEWVAQSRYFMPHFHIPLQSGCNRLLALMKRRYRRDLFEQKIRKIKSLMPHCCIGVDVIVGFPSESDDDFKDTLQFIQQLDISYLHVFTYSERDHTDALNIEPVVPMNIRNVRNKVLRDLSNSKLETFYKQNEGTVRNVLFERNMNETMLEGYSDNYVKVQTRFDKQLVNKITPWKITYAVSELPE